MDTYEQALLTVARAYSAATAEHGGKSLARVATIVANRGSFFDALEGGATCTVRNFEQFARYFAEPSNWPNASVPSIAAAALASVGRPTAEPAGAIEDAA
jgi:hypothetical protein